MLTLQPTFQVNKPKVYAPTQSMDLKSKLQISGKDTSEIDKKVEQEIQETKSKKITVDDFYDKVDQVKERHGLEDEQAYIKSLNMAKDRGYIVEGLDIDSEIEAMGGQIPESVQPVQEESETEEVKPERSGLYKAAQSAFKTDEERGVVGDAVAAGIANIPSIFANTSKFLIQGIGGGINEALGITSKEDNDKISESFDELGEKGKTAVQEFLDVNKDATSTQIGEFVSEIITPSPASKIKASGKLLDLFNKMDSGGKKLIKNIVVGATKGAGQGAEYSVVSEGELNKSDITTGATIGGGLPAAGGLINKATSVLNSGVKKTLQTFGRFDDETVKQIENNPDLVKKVLKGDITVGDVETTLKSQFKNQQDAESALDKVKELLVNKYNSYAVKGKSTRADIVENEVTDILTGKISEKSKIGQEFQEFLTDDVVGKQDDLVGMIDDVPGISKEGDTIIGQDARQAYEEISGIIKSYFTKEGGTDLTQKKLRNIEQAINAKANPTQAGAKKTAVQNIMSNYAKKVSDFAEEKIPGLKDASTQYREAVKTVKEIQSLATKGGNSMEVRDTLFSSLTNILKNPTKLNKMKEVFGDEIESKLKTIEEGIVFEKAMDQVMSIKSASSFIQKMKTGTSTQRNIPFKETVTKKLEEVSETEQQADFLKKMFKTDLGEETIGNISSSTISNIRKYGSAQGNKAIEELADVLDIIKGLGGKQTSDISVAAASSAAAQAAVGNPGQAAMFLFGTSKKTLVEMYSAYHKASSKLQGSLSKAKDPSNENIREFLQKAIIYGNINE